MMHFVLPAMITLALTSAASAQAPSQTTPAQEAASMRGYGDDEKSCQEWTDACVTCQRSDAGEPVCSNIGIACQPKAISCTRRMEEKK
jgi:hypothetical protein